MENKQETALQALESITNIVHKVVMDKLSYYTPSIEDLRIGYEFEYNGHYTHITSKWEKQVITEKWYGMNYTSGWDSDPTITFYLGMLKRNPNNFRVPYLTKEQIEAEGWVFTGESNPAYNNLLFRKSTWFLWLNEKEIWLQKGNQMKYDGPCPSINEFRTITKLLGI